MVCVSCNKEVSDWSFGRCVRCVEKELSQFKSMLLTVTAVCNGSTALDYLDDFRTADAMLQEQEKERFREVLERIARLNVAERSIAGRMRADARKVLAESV